MQSRGALKLVLRPLSVLSFVVVLVGVLVFASASALAAGDANEGGCPNEELREENNSSQLPDCRAYELVSPPFKAQVKPAFAAAPEAPETREASSVTATAGMLEGVLNPMARAKAGGYFAYSKPGGQP
jgi:hypothetical protein